LITAWKDYSAFSRSLFVFFSPSRHEMKKRSREEASFSLGHDVVVVAEDKAAASSLTCSICIGLLCSADSVCCVENEHHLFCLSCITQWEHATEGAASCPLDRCPLVVKPVPPEILAQVKALRVECPSAACDWTGPLQNLQVHISESCTLVQCDWCHDKNVRRSNLESHKNDHCPKRPLPCPDCGLSLAGDSTQLALHRQITCPKRRITTPVQPFKRGPNTLLGAMVSGKKQSSSTIDFRSAKKENRYKR
jgi:hypothetical protein